MATSSHGANLKLLIDATYTLIPGCGDIQFSQGTWNTSNATTHDSQKEEESIKTIRAGKSFSCTIDWAPDNAVHIALQAAFNAATASSFQIVCPDSGTKTFQFSANVLSLDLPAPVDGKLVAELSAAITGAITEDPA